MDFKQIQELIKLVNKSNLSELTIEEKDFKVTIRQKDEIIQQTVISGQFQSAPALAPAPAPAPAIAAAPAAPTTTAAPADDNSKYIMIKSPMIGTFYRTSNPDADPFVSVGDSVSSGQTVCIIEAMKLFNEIESEVSGTIVKILVDNASPVEYDQPLFLVDPY